MSEYTPDSMAGSVRAESSDRAPDADSVGSCKAGSPAATPGPWGLRGYQIRAGGGRGQHIATYVTSRGDGLLLAAAPELLEALASLAELYALPGESNVDRFERVAELFHRETGCMAPGKDVAAASGDSMSGVERLTRWENWYAARAEKARAAIAKAQS